MSTEQTAAVLGHHLESIGAGDVDAVMEDYAEESTLYTPDGPLSGLEAIRGFFDALMSGPFAEVNSFDMLRQDCEGEIAYIVWKADTAAVDVPLGTDTFIIRDGKIVDQTFAGHVVPKG